MIEEGLDEAPLEEFSTLISGTVIPTLIKIADKYNYDRDSMVKFAADTMEAMAEVSTFRNYKSSENNDSRGFENE